jgi:hypothetical protein
LRKAREIYNVIKKKRSISLRARSRLRQRRRLRLRLKKVANAANRAANKTAKEAEAAKKNNGKDKKTGYSAVINEIEEAIQLFFQDIDYGNPIG